MQKVINQNSTLSKEFNALVRNFYKKESVQLHEPIFVGNERKYVIDTIDSTFVSSVGKYVTEFEEKIAEFVGARYAVATGNGTAALHIALMLAGVEQGNEVIIPPLTFVAPCNAIKYCGADPVFVDIEKESLGLSPELLQEFLNQHTEIQNDQCINKTTGKAIKACMVVHIFGFPARVDELKKICDSHCIKLIEDASEALGSYYKNQHVGTFAEMGVFSFNGNKILTTGGGGMLVTSDESLAKRAKYMTTTAKQAHAWNYYHDEVGYNYRLPNINAALGCAQLEMLPKFLKAKYELAQYYQHFFADTDIQYFDSRVDRKPNYWLNTLLLSDRAERDAFLHDTNSNGVMTRPVWELMTDLPMYQTCQKTDISNATYMADRLVNIPSTPVLP